MNSSIFRQLTKTLAQALADTNNPHEVEKFLTDFFTEAELKKIIKKLGIVYWLKKGRDDQNIQKNLGANEKEILDAKKLLKQQGIITLLKKIEAEEWANIWAEKIRGVVK